MAGKRFLSSVSANVRLEILLLCGSERTVGTGKRLLSGMGANVIHQIGGGRGDVETEGALAHPGGGAVVFGCQEPSPTSLHTPGTHTHLYGVRPLLSRLGKTNKALLSHSNHVSKENVYNSHTFPHYIQYCTTKLVCVCTVCVHVCKNYNWVKFFQT